MRTANRGRAERPFIEEIVTLRGRASPPDKNQPLAGFLTAKSRKQAMGFAKNARLCGSCLFFEWLEVGKKNRCRAGDFASASQHGCRFYQRE